jgi:CDP-glucose 4,6-dehydratase
MASVSEFWQDRSTLVTGATGLAGGWLIPALQKRGARIVAGVRSLSRRDGIFARNGWSRRIPVTEISLGDCDGLRRVIESYQVDTIFHLAGQTQTGHANEHPLETLEANAGGAWNILEAARQTRHCQVLVASSEKVYAKGTSLPGRSLPHREDDPLGGNTPYGVSKTCVDLVAGMYAATYGLPVGVVRCANLFGGGDSNVARAIPGVILATLRGERFTIHSDGRSLHNFLYVEDAVEAYLLLAEKLDRHPELRGEAFNLSSERPISVLDVVDRVLTLMGRVDLEPVVLGQASSGQILLGQARSDASAQYVSVDKASRILGWQPRTSLEEGLRKTIAWYAESNAPGDTCQIATSATC